jgi:hypothetical protein
VIDAADEQTTNAIRPSIRPIPVRDFVISRFKLRGYLPLSIAARIGEAATRISG